MRVTCFIFLFILSTMLPLPVTLAAIAVYAFVWSGWELFALSVCLDAYFGAGSMVPYYTLGTTLILLIAEWYKPRLLIYNLIE